MSDKRYYWLKLPKDFFKRHDIKIIKAMPNGKDYVLFYLTLLLESLAHDGLLRFSDTIPYNEEMLSVITDTNIDTVRSAMKILQELHMVEILDDKTIYMTEVEKMIGGECWSAERMRKLRDKQIPPNVTLPSLSVTCDVEIEKEIDIDKENIGGKSSRFIPPTLQEVIDYCAEKHNGVDAVRFFNFYDAKGWMIGKNKMKNWHSAVATWVKQEQQQNGDNRVWK